MWTLAWTNNVPSGIVPRRVACDPTVTRDSAGVQVCGLWAGLLSQRFRRSGIVPARLCERESVWVCVWEREKRALHPLLRARPLLPPTETVVDTVLRAIPKITRGILSGCRFVDSGPLLRLEGAKALSRVSPSSLLLYSSRAQSSVIQHCMSLEYEPASEPLLEWVGFPGCSSPLPCILAVTKFRAALDST